jgi:tetraacyldisaccharide 4'-kinase
MKLNYPNFWSRRGFLCFLLSPIAGAYRLIIYLRHLLYKYNIKKTTKFKVPIIIIGNITVGGTGKTPLVIWLAEFLQQQGLRPGIVSRGYGSKVIYPYEVNKNNTAYDVGDEALLIKQRTRCPMVIAPNRVAAVQKLLKTNNCNIIISDDGLQHYALGRDLEIAVIDAEKRFGNGFCFPAGPLREPVRRLQQVDLILENGKSMQLLPNKLYNLAEPTLTKDLAEFKGKTVHAIAGIGNPQRFFTMLRNFGINVIEHPFPDHYVFTAQDLSFNDEIMVLMTEKDAVKCPQLVNNKYWCVPVTIKFDDKFMQYLQQSIRRVAQW